MEDDDIVYVGAVEQEIVLLESRTDEALLAVDVELDIILHHGLHIDGAEITYLGAPRVCRAVLLLQHLKPRYRVIRQVVQVLDARLDLLLQFLHQFVRFLGVELGDTDHADLE